MSYKCVTSCNPTEQDCYLDQLPKLFTQETCENPGGHLHVEMAHMILIMHAKSCFYANGNL